MARANKIGQAVQVLNDIAAELNVLALTTTIEASRVAEAAKSEMSSEAMPAGGQAA